MNLAQRFALRRQLSLEISEIQICDLIGYFQAKDAALQAASLTIRHSAFVFMCTRRSLGQLISDSRNWVAA